MPEDVHGPPEREVLHLRQLLRDGRQVDRVGQRGQPRLRLEPADEGDRAEAVRPHRRRPLHRLPPLRQHHRLRRPRERQDHQALEE